MNPPNQARTGCEMAEENPREIKGTGPQQKRRKSEMLIGSQSRSSERTAKLIGYRAANPEVKRGKWNQPHQTHGINCPLTQSHRRIDLVWSKCSKVRVTKILTAFFFVFAGKECTTGTFTPLQYSR